MKEMRKPEILAPAGSMDSLKAAVAAGCDAVYIGGSRFGARAYADNPPGDEMAEAIRYCHLYGVKIYITVNTLLKEREVREELYDYLFPFYKEGIDAAIVQDVGVMRYLHSHFPDLALHASTQMTLTVGKSTRLLEQYGVSRIVPARELTLPELVQMRKDTRLELEVFVHGALCYCYSGQCLFSSMLGGRSGNRGRCAQPCRMPYHMLDNPVVEGKGRRKEDYYFLSPKENCSLAYVGELVEAGVDSFKIEGRMKRPEYTAFTTAIYRKYVDLYFELGREGYRDYFKKHPEQWQEDRRKLGELYNRSGFTAGYLEGKAGVPGIGPSGQGMLSILRPNHGGIRVGKVLAADSLTVTYQLELDLHPQDVVEFRDDRERKVYEYTLGEEKKAGCRVTARYQKGCKILPGNLVYRTKDADLLEEIRENYIQREAKIPLQAVFYGKEKEEMILELECQRRDGQAVRLQVTGGVCEKAQNRPSTEDNIRKLLCQTGETPFVIRDLTVQLEGELFMAVKSVKQLRRMALEQMQGKLGQMGSRDMALEAGLAPEKQLEHRNSIPEITPDQQLSPVNSSSGTYRIQSRQGSDDVFHIASVLTWEQFEVAAHTEHVDAIYLKMDMMTDKQLKAAVHEGSCAGKSMYLALPAIFRNAVYESEKRKLSHPGNLYQMEQLGGFVIRNMESFVFLRDEVGVDTSKIVTDSNLYITNQEAMAYWREQGCVQMTLSLELTAKESACLSDAEGIQAVIYGHIPLMVSAQCLFNHTEGCWKQKEGHQAAMLSSYKETFRHGGSRGDGRQCPETFLTFQDHRDRLFYALNVCKYCYNVIYQGQPLVLGQEEKRVLLAQGIRRFRYDFSAESPEQLKRILAGQLPAGTMGHFYNGID